jgi:hypothetical protein
VLPNATRHAASKSCLSGLLARHHGNHAAMLRDLRRRVVILRRER